MSGLVYSYIAERLASGSTILLDGGTGTDIQRRGVPMDGDVWCAQANADYPDVVRSVHEDYIRAGADIITANTYASSPLLFGALGRGGDVQTLDRQAMRIARSAVEDTEWGRDIAIAGSLSILRRHVPGTDSTADDTRWTYREVRDLYTAKAEVLAEAGADLLIMEMMRDLELSAWATEASLSVGLPVWVGIAVERREDGELCGYGHPQCKLADIVSLLMADGPGACMVMHSAMSDIDDALTVIGANWAGPKGAYPEAGEFKMPDWQFEDVSPDDFAVAARRWRSMGATIIGGCCGINPEHISAAAKALKPQSSGT